MYPGPILLLGMMWATWNLAFLVGVMAGYWVLRAAYRLRGAPERPRFLPLRYGVVVYICALAAQMFAYAFDANTTLLPPEGVNALRYYFDPLAGPKTLYGAILVLPIAVAAAFGVAGNLPRAAVVDRFTPALMIVLASARVGCFLQGCCYGMRSDRFGIAFPVGSSVHADQVLAGLVHIDQPALAVLPTQIASAIACLTLAAWSYRALVREGRGVFLRTIVAYSIFRFAIEFFRADAARNFFAAFSTSQWIAIVVVAAVVLENSVRRNDRERYDQL